MAAGDKELLRQRSALYSKRYYWLKKLSVARSKKTIRKSRNVLLQINAEISAVNTKLGAKGKIQRKRERKRIKVDKNVISELVKVWEGRSKLTDALKSKQYKRIIFGPPVDEDFPRGYVVKIFVALSDLEDVAYKVRGGTPFFIFVYDLANKTLTINIY